MRIRRDELAAKRAAKRHSELQELFTMAVKVAQFVPTRTKKQRKEDRIIAETKRDRKVPQSMSRLRKIRRKV